MLKNIKQKLVSEKGFTLIELLIVISIIAILFVVLLPQIDSAGDRARQAGVKSDFRSFQIGAEAYLRETAGEGSTGAISGAEYNRYLDANMVLSADAGGTFLESAKTDPWGENYDVKIYPIGRTIQVFSWGRGEQVSTPDFALASYYAAGVTGSCTIGFDNNNIVAPVSLVADPADCATQPGTETPLATI